MRKPETYGRSGPEASLELTEKSKRLRYLLSVVLSRNPWSPWQRPDVHETINPLDIIFPKTKVRSRRVFSEIQDIKVNFEVRNSDYFHDEEWGSAGMLVSLEETQNARTAGLLCNLDPGTMIETFQVASSFFGYNPPGRPPKELTSQARTAGLEEGDQVWRPRIVRERHLLSFDSYGILINASMAFTNNPDWDPYFVRPADMYHAGAGETANGLRVVNRCAYLLDKGFYQ